MFDLPYEDRLRAWRNFRNYLEESRKPIQDTINFVNQAPVGKLEFNVWNDNEWPQPWELIEKNQFSEFAKILLICYTLQLTERFAEEKVEIHIGSRVENNEMLFLLYFGDQVIGYVYDIPVPVDQLPKSIVSQRIFTMPKLQ
jgi:hypothetical protein